MVPGTVKEQITLYDPSITMEGCPCGGTDDRAFGYDHESGKRVRYAMFR